MKIRFIDNNCNVFNVCIYSNSLALTGFEPKSPIPFPDNRLAKCVSKYCSL